MATADTAVELVRSHFDLRSGHCDCLFHRDCVQFLEKSSTGLCCRRCRATDLSLLSVTDRNCLRCGIYSADVLCRLCFDLLCNLVHANIRLVDQSVDLKELCKGFSISTSVSIAWVFLMFFRFASNLPFLIVEENGIFIARSRAWVLVEIWRKMLLIQQGIRLSDSADAFFYCFGNRPSSDIISQALDYLPQKGLCLENGLIQLVPKKPILTDDGYFALGRTLCASGLFDYYDQKRSTGQVDRYFVASKNDFVYYNDRAVLHIEADALFREKWLICVKALAR